MHRSNLVEVDQDVLQVQIFGLRVASELDRREKEKEEKEGAGTHIKKMRN
jgi:hypothetical protein